MKKQLLGFTGTLFAFAAIAQLPVNNNPENRKAIIEEYTGIHCQYCPDGHKKVDQIVAANPGNAFGINFHVGGYATPSAGEPDFRTSFGTPIAAQASLTGYPAGSINRYVFAGLSQTPGGTAMSRGTFASASNAIMNDPSYLNVALQGTIDAVTRVLKVDVEVYYTDNSPVSTNFLNVALIQDSILGPQTGATTWYPEKMVNGKYQHDKVFRTFLTGQWGDAINTTSTGFTFAKQYTYTIPAQLPIASTSSISIKTDVLLRKLRVIAYVTQSQQVIVSGNTGPLTIVNSSPSFSLFKTDASNNVIAAINNGNTISETTSPSSTTLTKLKLKNIHATQTQTFNVTRTIISQNPTLDQTPAAVAPTTYFCFGNNCFGSSVNTPGPADYTILLPSGQTNTIFPLADNSVDNNQPFSIDLDEGSVIGSYLVKYKVFNVANLNDTLSFFISYNPTLGVKTINDNSGMNFDIYPNPANTEAIIRIVSSNSNTVGLKLTNAIGQSIFCQKNKLELGANKISLDCKNLSSGIYFLTLETETGSVSKKLMISK